MDETRLVMIRGIPKEGWKPGFGVAVGSGFGVGDDQRNP
jgi:hypothetical protein